jgi:hypothetical protein
LLQVNGRGINLGSLLGTTGIMKGNLRFAILGSMSIVMTTLVLVVVVLWRFPSIVLSTRIYSTIVYLVSSYYTLCTLRSQLTNLFVP